jgi:hypothetical protein
MAKLASLLAPHGLVLNYEKDRAAITTEAVTADKPEMQMTQTVGTPTARPAGRGVPIGLNQRRVRVRHDKRRRPPVRSWLRV